jgi:hypothetical protein
VLGPKLFFFLLLLPEVWFSCGFVGGQGGCDWSLAQLAYPTERSAFDFEPRRDCFVFC